MGGQTAHAFLCRLSIQIPRNLTYCCSVLNMGNVLPTSAAQQEVDELRRKVIDLFSGQQFLLVGHYGVGKSSFINSVNHVFNVIRDPKFPYQEVAEIFQRETDHGSLVYTTYRPDTTGMYKGLETKELLAKREHAPVFFDVAGINDKIANEIDFKQLLIYLVNGQVKEYTQMIKIYKREEQMDYLAKIPKMDTLRAWSILCVVSLCDAFPQKFLEQVNEAVRQLQVDQGGKNDLVTALCFHLQTLSSTSTDSTQSLSAVAIPRTVNPCRLLTARIDYLGNSDGGERLGRVCYLCRLCILEHL